MPKLLASNLEVQRMAEAYPLIRRLARVSLEQWLSFGRQLAGQGGGMIAVRAEDGPVQGVAAYLPVASLRHGKALRVDAIAAFELGHLASVRGALSQALDDVAESRGCTVVMVSLDAQGMCSPRSRRRRGWESLGLAAETIEFVRHLHDPPCPGQPE